MKLGVIGLGSIGQRHVRVLAGLGETDVVALRSGQGAIRDLPADLGHVSEVWDADAFWRMPLDGVLITNPTSLHGAALGRAAEAKLPTFVEKPLAGELRELPDLPAAAMDRVVVGFCLRFHPLVKALRSFIQGDAAGGPSTPIGRIMKARLYFGSYLPRWHPQLDYRIEYMSRADLGGGVLRTACHEIDLVHYLLGPMASVAGDVRRVSDLEIDVDDSVMLTCRMRSGATVLIELDYLNPEPSRTGSLIGSGGRLDYALSPPTARFVGYDRSAVEVYSNAAYSLDEMYRAQMADFLRFVQTGRTDGCSYAEGLEVMRVIAAAARLSATPVEQSSRLG